MKQKCICAKPDVLKRSTCRGQRHQNACGVKTTGMSSLEAVSRRHEPVRQYRDTGTGTFFNCSTTINLVRSFYKPTVKTET